MTSPDVAGADARWVEAEKLQMRLGRGDPLIGNTQFSGLTGRFNFFCQTPLRMPPDAPGVVGSKPGRVAGRAATHGSERVGAKPKIAGLT